MGRYQKVERPQNIPGHCFLTLSDQEEWFIDTMIDNDLPWGSVYIGKSALEEMARLVGMEYVDVIKAELSKNAQPEDKEDITPVGSEKPAEFVERDEFFEYFTSQFGNIADLVQRVLDRDWSDAKRFHPATRHSPSAEQGSTESSDVEELGSVYRIKSNSKSSAADSFDL